MKGRVRQRGKPGRVQMAMVWAEAQCLPSGALPLRLTLPFSSAYYPHPCGTQTYLFGWRICPVSPLFCFCQLLARKLHSSYSLSVLVVVFKTSLFFSDTVVYLWMESTSWSSLFLQTLFYLPSSYRILLPPKCEIYTLSLMMTS